MYIRDIRIRNIRILNPKRPDLFTIELEGCFVCLYLFGCFRVDIVEMMIGMFCYSYQHGTLDLTD